MAENNNNNDDQIFNEDELQDIMNEFESLEREFNEGDAPQAEEVVAASEPVVTSESTTEEVLEEGELTMSVESEASNVVPMASAKPKAKPTAPVSTQSISSNAQGVSMSLEFPIGDQVAQIGLSPEYGFSFNMDGVEITIDSENGCVMTLPGGMTFTIPVDQVSKVKKSA